MNYVIKEEFSLRNNFIPLHAVKKSHNNHFSWKKYFPNENFDAFCYTIGPPQKSQLLVWSRVCMYYLVFETF